MSVPETFRIREELESMPELARIQRVSTQQLTCSIFDGNTRDLRRLLRLHSDTKEDLSLWDIDNREQLYALQKEIGRLLHNFVASAATLVDITRRLSEEYKDEQFPDYQPKINLEFINDPLSQFIKGLRNYAVHYEAPPIVSQMNFEFKGDADLNCQVVMPSKKLLAFSGWNAVAKSYISSCGDEIVLDSVVEDYYLKVDSFYNWFYSRLNEIHEVDLQRVNAKEEELKRAYVPHPADLLDRDDKRT